MFAIRGHLQRPQGPLSWFPLAPMSILSHARTHARTHSTYLVRPGNLPQPSSSRVERQPHHATVLAQGKPHSLCGPLLGPGSPPTEPTMPRKSLLATPTRGAFPAGKSSELTAASCHVKAPRALGAPGPGRGWGWDSPSPPSPPSLFSLLLSMYSSLDLSTFLKPHFV